MPSTPEPAPTETGRRLPHPRSAPPRARRYRPSRLWAVPLPPDIIDAPVHCHSPKPVHHMGIRFQIRQRRMQFQKNILCEFLSDRGIPERIPRQPVNE